MVDTKSPSDIIKGMKKIITGLVALSLVLLLIPVAHADQENLDLLGAYEAQASKCDFKSGPLLGTAWDECEQYLYEFANLAGQATSSQALMPVRQQIIDLIQAISDLNASFAGLSIDQ